MLCLFPLDGNTIYQLDLAYPTNQNLSTYFCTHQFASENQKQNFYKIASSLDWNIIPVLKARGFNTNDISSLIAQTTSLAYTTNQYSLFAFLIDKWDDSWSPDLAIPLLQKTAIVCPILEKKLKHVTGITNVQIKTSFSYSVQSIKPVRPVVFWLEKNGLYAYTAINGQWYASPTKLVHSYKILAKWTRPSGFLYSKNWMPEKSWQTTYTFTNSVLTRTATFMEQASYIVGHIQGQNFTEIVNNSSN